MLLPTASGAQQTMFLFAGCRTIAPRTTQELLPTTVHSLELTVRHRPKGIKSGYSFHLTSLRIAALHTGNPTWDGNKVQRTHIGRYTAVTWVLSNIFRISWFTGAVASLLIVERLTHCIHGLDDLAGKRLRPSDCRLDPTGKNAAEYLTFFLMLWNSVQMH